MSECICEGNWRAIVGDYHELIGRVFVDDVTGERFRLFGLVHADDDYYYGMANALDGRLSLMSCVSSIAGHGLSLEAE